MAATAVIGIISLVVSAASSISQGMKASDTARYNQQVAQEKARQARLMGEYNASLVQYETDQSRREAAEEFRRAQATSRVNTAVAGIDLSSGSMLEVMSGLAAQNQSQLLEIEYSGALKAQHIHYTSNVEEDKYLEQARTLSMAKEQSDTQTAFLTGSHTLDIAKKISEQ